MQLLDPFTLYFLLMATLLLLSLLLLLMGRVYRQERALRWWGGSGLLGVVGVLLLMARDVLHVREVLIGQRCLSRVSVRR